MTYTASIDADVVLARVLREGADGLLTRGEAAALIASRLNDGRDTEKTARNRVGMRLDRAGERGRDVQGGGGLARTPNGGYTVDEIARWAREAYPGVFDDIPIKPRQQEMTWRETASLGSSMQYEVTPGNLEECQRLVKDLREQLRLKNAEQVSAEAERKRKLVSNFKRK